MYLLYIVLYSMDGSVGSGVVVHCVVNLTITALVECAFFNDELDCITALVESAFSSGELDCITALV